MVREKLTYSNNQTSNTTKS